MQTIPFLPHQEFDPELVRSMSLAYANVCRALALGLSTKPDPATEVVALKIVEVAERGARTPTTIYLLAIEEFSDGK
jgi:hypothetical protein